MRTGILSLVLVLGIVLMNAQMLCCFIKMEKLERNLKRQRRRKHRNAEKKLSSSSTDVANPRIYEVDY